jgi:hypothetical protein
VSEKEKSRRRREERREGMAEMAEVAGDESRLAIRGSEPSADLVGGSARVLAPLFGPVCTHHYRYRLSITAAEETMEYGVPDDCRE